MTIVRGSSLLGFDALVRELGADPVALLAAVRLTPDVCGDPDAFVHYVSANRALESAAAITGAPDFGRRLALRQGLEILGPVGVAARTAQTVGAGLAAIEQFMAVYSPAVSSVLDLQDGARFARYQWRLLPPNPPPHRQATELAVSIAIGVVGLLAGDFTSPSVHFRHDPVAERDNYRAYYGCPVRFGADFDGFLVPRAVLARPVADDAAVHAVVRDYLSALVTPGGGQITDSVRTIIARALPTGSLTLDLVAAHVALHPRTLQRHLREHGTSFAALVDEVRREQAARYLADTDVTLEQLARLLGYSEPSAVARACRRWFGRTSRELRAAAPSL